MGNNNILICDEDENFARAFSSFVVTHMPDVKVKVFTNVSDFIRCMSEETYQIGMFTESFLNLIEEARCKVKKTIYLYESSVEEKYMELPSIYKFQSMDITMETIKRLLDVRSIKLKKEKTIFEGVISPCRHELSLPFSLALCEIYAERESVLFVDLDEMSILPRLIENSGGKNILDLIQRLQRQNGIITVEDYCETLLGFSYVRPIFCPGVYSEIEEAIFKDFLCSIKEGSFDRVVFLIGQGLPGIMHILEEMDEIVLLARSGDYYKKSQVEFLKWSQGKEFEDRLLVAELPMSAGNLTEGAYKIEELIQGHLGIFVRRFLAENDCEEESKWTA